MNRSSGMTRRRFAQGAGVAGLALLAGCGRWPWQAAQQPPRVVRVGFLVGAISTSSPWVEAFREGLREHGWIEGQNIIIDFRSAEGRPGQLPEIVAELIWLRPDIMVVGGPEAGRVIKEATSTIPVVL